MPTKSKPKSIATPTCRETSELLTLNSSENPSESFESLLSKLYLKRDRLKESAISGSVQPYQKKNKTYWNLHTYCPKKRKTIGKPIDRSQVGRIQAGCEAWRELKEVERAIKELCEWRDRFNSVLRGVP